MNGVLRASIRAMIPYDGSSGAKGIKFYNVAALTDLHTENIL
jgi:hypothetical protein